MTATTDRASLARLCSLCAQRAGLDAGGTAYSYEHALAVEVPLPWPMSMYSEPGVLPHQLLDLRRKLVAAYQRGEPISVSALAIAPDPAYSVLGYRRVISYRRPAGPFARFAQTEYLAPEAHVGALCWALLIDQAALPRFAEFQLPLTGARDVLICTHGAVDAACAKFGFPLYRQLRRQAEAQAQLRVWRVSHFGGHVFAPTLIDMPEFRYWAYVEPAQAEQLLARAGDGLHVWRNYRGWAGFAAPALQIAERELFARHGWPWAEYLKTGRVLAQAVTANADEPAWAEVQIEYAAPDGSARGAYIARVELARRVECIASTGDPEPYAYPQYCVTRLERVATEQGASFFG